MAEEINIADKMDMILEMVKKIMNRKWIHQSIQKNTNFWKKAHHKDKHPLIKSRNLKNILDKILKIVSSQDQLLHINTKDMKKIQNKAQIMWVEIGMEKDMLKDIQDYYSYWNKVNKLELKR